MKVKWNIDELEGTALIAAVFSTQGYKVEGPIPGIPGLFAVSKPPSTRYANSFPKIRVTEALEPLGPVRTIGSLTLELQVKGVLATFKEPGRNGKRASALGKTEKEAAYRAYLKLQYQSDTFTFPMEELL